MSQPISQPVNQDSVCILYTRDSGQIIFIHRTTTLGDLAPLSEQEMETAARESMQLTMEPFGDRPPEGLAALFVSPDAFIPGHSYAVDYRTGALTERPSDRPTP